MINFAEETHRIANDMAKQYAQIIESELEQVVEIYKCDPKDITLQVHYHTKYKVLIKVKEFEITNNFTWEGKNE